MKRLTKKKALENVLEFPEIVTHPRFGPFKPQVGDKGWDDRTADKIQRRFVGWFNNWHKENFDRLKP